jgi:hypothetical protein
MDLLKSQVLDAYTQGTISRKTVNDFFGEIGEEEIK